MRHFKFCIFLLFVYSLPCVAQRTLDVAFAPSPIQLDGMLDEWVLPIIIHHKSSLPYQNQVSCGLYWDQEYLYVAFEVIDYQLSMNESGDDNERLYLNDAIEIYIDSKNDSHGQMDLNDYQLLVSMNGQKTIFKGDKQQIWNGSHVPKDHEGANIIIHTKSVIYGTINNFTDIDSGYQVEVAVPWSAIGIIPKEGLLFKIDLCNDDVDTTADIRTWPETFHPASMNYVNLSGKSDFGFPDDWVEARLKGSSDWKYGLLLTLHSVSTLMKVLLGSFFLLVILSFWYQNSRLRFYRNFPKKDSWQASTPENSDELKKKLPLLSPEIDVLKRYIQQHIDEDIPVEEIASEINISVRQLQRLLRAELDKTPKQYITILKLEKAEDLLRNSQYTVSEIAFKCGFADPSYFGSVFKKYFGITPAEYRKG